ncbi:helix-turn-helix domain-containing protein [Paenibacillus larvae]
MGPPQESNGYIKILGLIIFQNGANINEIMYKVHISRSTVYRQIDKN